MYKQRLNYLYKKRYFSLTKKNYKSTVLKSKFNYIQENIMKNEHGLY